VARIVIAAPVIAATTFSELSNAADEIAALRVPDDFGGVGQCYEDFSQTTDAEVQRLLGEQDQPPRTPDLFGPK
jgi:putative phosphoribosyl transferase